MSSIPPRSTFFHSLWPFRSPVRFVNNQIQMGTAGTFVVLLLWARTSVSQSRALFFCFFVVVLWLVETDHRHGKERGRMNVFSSEHPLDHLLSGAIV